MGKDSKIGWTDHTFNPWWGCVKVSPACTNCYAEALDGRYHGDDPHWGLRARRRFMSDKHWNQPLKWNREAAAAGVRARVFCASMADVFEQLPDGHSDAELMALARLRLWGLISKTPDLDWLLLTKRPENFASMLPWAMDAEPWPNVWLGVTAENQRYANERIPLLQAAPAVVRFVSYEPALERVDFDWYLRERVLWSNKHPHYRDVRPPLDWIIAGAESGAGRRDMDEDWVRAVRDACKHFGVAFFYKQRIEGGRKVELPVLDNKVHDDSPCPTVVVATTT